MTQAYVLLRMNSNPLSSRVIDRRFNVRKSEFKIMRYLSRISKDPPLSITGLCDLISIYKNIWGDEDREIPKRVYCSTMCRGIMTALILYPNGGKDGKIHIVPWIHEQPHCAQTHPVSRRLFGEDYAGLEMAFTKKSRMPREYSQMGVLINKITSLFHSDDKDEIMEILGNEHASDLLSQYKITAEFVPHHTLDASHSDDPDPTRFMKEILEPDFMNELLEKSGTVETVGIVSHGYTMKSGCKSYETTQCSGWCNTFACVPEENKVDYNNLLREGGSFPNGSHIEVVFRLGKARLRADLQRCITGEPTVYPVSEHYTQLRKEERELVEELVTGGLEDYKISHIGKGFNPISVSYTPDPGISPPFLSGLYTANLTSGPVFKEATKICMRNMLYHWSHFSPITEGNECTITLEEDFCNKEKFQEGMKRWEEIKSNKLLTQEEFSMFLPYLT